jgi:hypothetical protein
MNRTIELVNHWGARFEENHPAEQVLKIFAGITWRICSGKESGAYWWVALCPLSMMACC